MDLLLQAQTTLESFHVALLFLIPLTLLLVSLSRTRGRTRAPYPPGPKGLPIIGNMLIMNQLTHQGLANLAKQYGGVLHLRMGFLHIVAISTAATAREVLQVQDNIFSNRPATIAISYLTYDRADMSFAHYGPMWRQMRKLFVMKLFSRHRTESWRFVRDQVDTMVRALGSSIGKPVNIRDMLFNLTKNIIYTAAFGCCSQESEDDEFVGIIEEFSKLFGAFNIVDFVPCLGWLDQQGFKSRLTKARGALDSFIDKIIEEHVLKNKRNSNGGDEETDVVDELLALIIRNEVELDDTQDSTRFTKDNIKGLIMDMMFGGTDTVALTIEWVIAELMRNPQDLNHVQQELVDVVGLARCHVDDTDFDNLNYLKCAIKETLRLHPPIPLLLHETAEDAVVAGYFIPKKSRVLINTWAIGRDSDFWEDPHTFNPSRFLNSDAPDFKGINFEFIPFGSGRRSCPGMKMGLYALELAVAHLLHCFTWELPYGMKPCEMDMSDEFGLTTPRASQLVAVPSKRVVCPL